MRAANSMVTDGIASARPSRELVSSFVPSFSYFCLLVKEKMHIDVLIGCSLPPCSREPDSCSR